VEIDISSILSDLVPFSPILK